MMKQLFVFFMLLFLPVVVVADNWLQDGCVENGRYKSEYTIDRRCYVTDEQKQQSPYNAVVGLLNTNDDINCTGTIVKRDGGYFLYTAKHCTDNDRDNRSDKVLRIELQDGRTFDTPLVNRGNYDILRVENVFGDWAIYKIPAKKDDNTLPFVQTNSFKDGKTQIVGYGSLGILSDEQIKQAKADYVKYLIKLGVGSDEESLKQDGAYRLTEDGGIIGGILFELFTMNKRWMYNTDLKVSDCELSKGKLKGCQVWRGNSGGPLFNDHGEIMGVASTGLLVFGGAAHAGANLMVGVYSDKKNNGKQRNWVASADGEEQAYYTRMERYYEQQEREAAEKMRQYAKKNIQNAVQDAKQNRMEMFYIHQQNKQMMMDVNKQY